MHTEGRNRWHLWNWTLVVRKLWIALALGWGMMGALRAQVIDENTPQVAPLPSVGEHGAFDFFAQSFEADIDQVTKIGVWLRADSLGGEVQLAIVGNTAANEPDLGNVLHQTALIAPDTNGAWVYDSGFVALMVPGNMYWVVVDGYANVVADGYSSVGISSVFTDTNLPIYGSTDGAATWNVVLGNPMAVYVEGDTCNFNVGITSESPIVCPGDAVTLSVPSGHLGYTWSTGATSSSIDITTGGTYTVTVVNANLCTATASVVLGTASRPDPGLVPQHSGCEGTPINLVALPFYSNYDWSTGGSSATETVVVGGLYWVEVTDAAGCRGRDSTWVNIFPSPQVAIGNDTTLCDGMQLFLDAGAGFDSYAWSQGSSNRSIFATVSGNYWVRVRDSNNCSANSDTVRLDVYPNPTSPTITPTLSGIMSSFGFSYVWMRDGDTLAGVTSQSIENPSPGAYVVEVANGFGCTARSDSFVVVGEETGSFVSEGFSPNGDGLNEVFFVEGIENYPDNALSVFNRYGDVVYYKKGYANDWQGTGPGGRPLPDGNYFYVLELGGNLLQRRGAVLINR